MTDHCNSCIPDILIEAVNHIEEINIENGGEAPANDWVKLEGTCEASGSDRFIELHSNGAYETESIFILANETRWKTEVQPMTPPGSVSCFVKELTGEQSEPFFINWV